jgi:imidazole glycerol-phosphate synthase subunit HisF
MLTRRLIVCLDVRGERVVKGVEFEGLRDVGSPSELAQRYEAEGADEIVFLDIAAGAEARSTSVETVRRTAERLFIPLTVGGGVSTRDHVGQLLRAGADRVSINSAAVSRPELIAECAEAFGSQCVIASIDARREEGSWRVYVRGGRSRTPLDAVAWAQRCAELGAGEILLTSIDRDGTRSGYDIELTQAVSQAVDVPVIASGGAGSAADVVRVCAAGGADAALVAGLLHDRVTTVGEIKLAMCGAGVPTRG